MVVREHIRSYKLRAAGGAIFINVIWLLQIITLLYNEDAPFRQRDFELLILTSFAISIISVNYASKKVLRLQLFDPDLTFTERVAASFSLILSASMVLFSVGFLIYQTSLAGEYRGETQGRFERVYTNFMFYTSAVYLGLLGCLLSCCCFYICLVNCHLGEDEDRIERVNAFA